MLRILQKVTFIELITSNKGSVTALPLFDDGEDSLWLEHVVNVNDPNDICFWFMWYNDGNPSIPMSGVINSEDIVKVISNNRQITF